MSVERVEDGTLRIRLPVGSEREVGLQCFACETALGISRKVVCTCNV
jgi:hypothetical protein